MAGLADNDTVTTIGEGGKRVWLYPKWIRGKMLTARTAVHWLLIVLLLIGPWIDIGGHPATRIDIPGRRIYFWGATLMATDGAYLLFLFGFVVFGVFFVTALFGRAWCGWSCPQTVFLESLIRPVERLIEGEPSKRRKLDAAPWKGSKFVKKGLKYAFYLVVAGGVGTTFTAYFLGRDGVIEAQLNPLSHPGGTATFVIITGLLLFDFAYFREQTCLVVCPYGRFQSVLLDRDSLAVLYDEGRGEPRGKAKDPNAGDCVDCKACVQVCPTGIDIRKGVQMECIQCMACIDACDSIMVKLQRDPGLIRLDSERHISASLAGKGKTDAPAAADSTASSAGAPAANTNWLSRAFRPRVVIYGLGLIAVFSILVFVLGNRQPVGLDLHRRSGVAPYVQMGDGSVQNSLELRIQNRSGEPRQFTVELVDEDGTNLLVPGGQLTVEAETTRQFPLFLIRPSELGGGDVELRVHDEQGFTDSVSIEFLAGSRPADDPRTGGEA
ncbi:cytochrome c oxidase accessory protein CcoG [Pseudenhygromyxa sp. WMMC2535]|uniref:cytochrome c oxidase accessory protein CcoG n=1 Tax=Pseudenhygromyxa sp. WMMC2535 TaxID=2712867 RepID=UPI001551E7E4|nr:cytochrome c oxidase accessory protein CcoG [Pseudenhygromyxa sp. WMMC2535]NVB40599.1 cytochrome c oxidase accessory protein CcoG [Pseudenhygromyxa sp. WMMC2535]